MPEGWDTRQTPLFHGSKRSALAFGVHQARGILGRPDLDDLELYEVLPVRRPFSHRCLIVRFHDLEAPFESEVHPAGDVAQAVWRQTAALAKAAVHFRGS